MHQEERRQRRSQDPLIALHYQLAHARTASSLETIVVADASGVVVAGAGSWAACEELAAYAPLLARAEGPRVGTLFAGADPLLSRVDALREETTVTRLEVMDQEVLVCARGGAGRAAALEATAFGVTRILSAAA